MKIFNYCIIIAILGLISCKSTDPCAETPGEGNIGSVLNSGSDDYLPVVYGDKIFFTNVSKDKKTDASIEKIYQSKIREDGMFEAPETDNKFPANAENVFNPGTPAFYFDTLNNRLEMYFAALAGDLKKHRDIYFATKTDGKWSTPAPLKFNVSTPNYEAHPAISHDGKLLVFSSDRPGTIGETDLFVSRRLRSGGWSNPVSLGGAINTRKREISPYITNDGSLLYASTGFKNDTVFNIVRADYLGNGRWGNPRLLAYPINSDADDNGPTMHEGKIILSSNRDGGCGGYDIYSFDMCGSAVITGKIGGTNTENINTTSVELYQGNGTLLSTVVLYSGEEYWFEVLPNNSYKIKFDNKCSGKEEVIDFAVPCSDTSVIKFVADFDPVNSSDKYYFERYDIPFFVSGYYFPNTVDNLESMRNKFKMKLLGTADSTRYIEYPGKEYDAPADSVDGAFRNLLQFVMQKLKLLSGECALGTEQIIIKIKGFADPRPISGNAKYAERDIDDPEMNLTLSRGTVMDNKLLSILRAYYTAKELQTYMLVENDMYDAYRERIKWEISGEGEDATPNIENLEKRRVSIEIEVKK